MRIWLLSAELPQHLTGGIGRYLINFARLFGAAGHEAVIIACAQEPCDELIAPGARLIGIAPRETVFGDPDRAHLFDMHPFRAEDVLTQAPARSYHLAEAVLNLLKELPTPDAIESPEYTAIPYFLLQRKLTEQTQLTRIPVVVSLRGPLFDYVRPCPFDTLPFSFVLDLPDGKVLHTGGRQSDFEQLLHSSGS